MKTASLSFVLTLVSGSLLIGQETPKFTFDLGAGFTETVGSTRTQLDKTGFNLGGGAGFNVGHGLGVKLDLGYNYFGINGATLNSLGVPGGDVSVFTALVNPVYHVTAVKKFDFYVTGGGGLFRQNQQFTAPVFTTVAAYNPFFGYFPVQGVATQLLSQYSVNKPGYDVGGGVEWLTKWHGKVFAEARYEHMFNTDSHTDIIPVTFGFRW
jgi:opacity protein-like surface antigen